jgi:hypothetical protein
VKVLGPQLDGRVSPSVQRSHEVAVMVAGIRIRGMLRGPSTVRLSDLMNERDPFLALSDGVLLPAATVEPIGPVALSTCLVGKDHIDLVWPVDTAADDPGARDLRVTKQSRRARLRFTGFTVDADLHIADGATLQAAVVNSPIRFVPATNATITPLPAGDGGATFRQPFVLLNRQRIVFLGELDADRAQP